jgi:hypothetical protein
LLLASAQRLAVADVEGDRLRVYSLSTSGLTWDVALPQGSWPVKVLEDSGTFFVLLRGTGEVAMVAPGSLTVSRTAVCPEPRGMALEAGPKRVVVVCAGGEVVHLAGRSVVDRHRFEVEWRDVAFDAQGLVGTSFRSAERVSLGSLTAAPLRQRAPAQRVSTLAGDPTRHEAQVAWKMVQLGEDSVLVHQLHADQLHLSAVQAGESSTRASAYGGRATGGQGPTLPCAEGAVVTALSVFGPDGAVTAHHTNDVLPVDAAVSPDGTRLAVVGAGGTGLSIYATSSLTTGEGCLEPTVALSHVSLSSVAWVSNGRLAVLESLRSVPVLVDLDTGTSSMLGNDADRGSPAHALFHTPPQGGAALACASCHPESGEDGHVWRIDGKARRTQSLLGGVMQRAPFHWQGDLSDLSSLMADTFQTRMGGHAVSGDDVAALGRWLDALPAPRSSTVLTAELARAGAAAFEKANCGGCHFDGGKTEGPSSDIGTGEAVRAPSLIGLQARAPFLHTGEVPSIRARVLGALHPQHGDLSRLGLQEKEQLISYLESL